ncbi:beta-lactamase/transpeptidase-like protein [Pholiota molesta]|nr:beta-lactamase/transpeptidase-like protein [Pholiota molesta]
MVHLIDSGKKALDDLSSKIVEGKTLPAFVFGAATLEEEIYFNAGGYKIVDDPASGKVTGDTVFWIAALQLIDQGKLTPDAPVSKFFPQFLHAIIVDDIESPASSYTPAKNPVTVKHLLNFSSGLFYPPIPRSGSRMPGPYSAPHDMKDPHTNFSRCYSTVHGLRYNEQGDLPGIPLKFEPGTDFVYGFSSDILGFIVEKISGKTLEAYFQENIFAPLEMKGSFYLTPDLKERMLTLTRRTPDGKLEHQAECKIIEQDYTKVSRHMGGVGLYTTLRDYLKLLRHILQIHAGKATNPILSLESVQSLFVGTSTEAGVKNLDLFTASAPTKGNSWSTALAVSSVDAPGRRKKGSAFWSGWAGTYFFMDPTTGLAGVYGTQLNGTVSGSRDPENLEAFTAFEETLYAGLA